MGWIHTVEKNDNKYCDTATLTKFFITVSTYTKIKFNIENLIRLLKNSYKFRTTKIRKRKQRDSKIQFFELSLQILPKPYSKYFGIDSR